MALQAVARLLAFALLRSWQCCAARATEQQDLQELQQTVRQLQQDVAALQYNARPQHVQIASDADAVHVGGADDASCSAAPDRLVVARPQVTWPELLSFHIAVRTRARTTAACLVDAVSASRSPDIFALGDEAGTLYVFDWQGHVLREHSADACFGAVTALHAVRMRRGVHHIVAGYANGCIVFHRLSTVDHEYTPDNATSPRYVDPVSLTQLPSASYCPPCIVAASEAQPASSAISHVFVGRVSEKTKRNVAVAANAAGDIFVLRERGMPPHVLPSGQPLLALQHHNRQLRAMTAQGFLGTPLLSTNSTLRHLPCQGLNDTALLAAHFDATMHSRVHGVAADGTFVSFSLPGDMRTTACRQRLRVPMATAAPAAAATLAALDELAIVAQDERIAAYDVANTGRQFKRPKLLDSMYNFARHIGLQSNPVAGAPLLATNSGSHLAVQLASSVIAVYSTASAAQPTPPAALQVDWVKWLRPVMLLGMLVIGSTYFARAKSSSAAARFGGYAGAMNDQQRLEAVLRTQRMPAPGGTARRHLMQGVVRDRHGGLGVPKYDGFR